MNSNTKKPKSFWHKNRKTDIKLAKTAKRKSQCPPSDWRMIRISRLPSSMAAIHSTPWYSLWKWLHGVLGQTGLRLIVSRRLYFGLLYNISNFHGKYFDLFHTPPFYLNSLLFGKWFDCFIFQRVFFCETWSDPWGFWAEKTFSGACAQLCHAEFLACHTKFIILFYMIRSMIRYSGLTWSCRRCTCLYAVQY